MIIDQRHCFVTVPYFLFDVLKYHLTWLQAVINANIIPRLVHLLPIAEFDIRKFAARAISNATSGGTHDQIKYVNIYFNFVFFMCAVLFVYSRISFIPKAVKVTLTNVLNNVGTLLPKVA
jgi:hypothetical protein